MVPKKSIQNLAEKKGEMGVPEQYTEGAAKGDVFNGGRSFADL